MLRATYDHYNSRVGWNREKKNNKKDSHALLTPSDRQVKYIWQYAYSVDSQMTALRSVMGVQYLRPLCQVVKNPPKETRWCDTLV